MFLLPPTPNQKDKQNSQSTKPMEKFISDIRDTKYAPLLCREGTEQTKMIPCPNKLCPNYGKKCWDHCNHCGENILWRPPLLDREIKYTGPKPLEPDGRTVHRCMKGGTKDGHWYKTDPAEVERKFLYPRVKASVIICADPDCNTPIVERTEPLLQQFQLHLEKYHGTAVAPDYIKTLQFKIDRLRNGRSAYVDPFIHVPWDEIREHEI